MPNFVVFVVLIAWIIFAIKNQGRDYIYHIIISLLISMFISIGIGLLSVNFLESKEVVKNIYPLDSNYTTQLKFSNNKDGLVYLVNEKDSLGNLHVIEIPSSNIILQLQSDLPRMQSQVTYTETNQSWLDGKNLQPPTNTTKKYKVLYLPENYHINPQVLVNN